MRTWQQSGRDSTHIENKSGGGGFEPRGWIMALIVITGLLVFGVLSRDEALQLLGVDPPAYTEAVDDDGQRP